MPTILSIHIETLNPMKTTSLLVIILISQFLNPAKSLAQDINVGIDLWPGYYPIVLAKHLGYFKKRGLNVNFVLPESTDNMLGQFTDGKLDMVCVAMGDAFSLYKQDPGLRVVMITDESSGGDALLAKRRSGKNEQGKIRQTDFDFTSLRGKKIGTNLEGFGELFINTFLKEKGVDPKSIKLVHQEAAGALTALQSGKVDIVHTWEPYVTEIQSFNLGDIIFDSSKTPGLIPDALLANGNFIKDRPKDLALFIQAWLEASDWWRNNLKEGNAIIESEMVMMPDSVSLDGVKLYGLESNVNAFKPSNDMSSLFYVTQLYIDFFVSKGLIDPSFKPDQIIDGKFLSR